MIEKLHDRIRLLTEPRQQLQGWCDYTKAKMLADIIVSTTPELVVEIGVYGGASLIPMAMAVAHVGKGRVIGIDPWKADESLAGMENESNKDFWSKQDYNGLRKDCEYFLAVNKLRKWCELRQARSCDAVHGFENASVGLLHIDGNHGAQCAMQDAMDWFPKVKPGGVIVWDDIGWTEGGKYTVRPAVMWMLDHGCETDNAMENYLVLRKGLA